MLQKKSKKTRRIFWATSLVLIMISALGWMRFQQALRHWYYLIELDIQPHPIYSAVTGGWIGIAYVLGLLFHLARKSFTAIYLRFSGVAVLIWLWIDRIFISKRVFFSLLLAGTVFLTLCMIAFDGFLFQKNGYVRRKNNVNATEN